ncbi:endopeptidase La, partial [Candidatus Roizmanbacteria bacterium CG_4_9_14_3_um_filter_33_18]
MAFLIGVSGQSIYPVAPVRDGIVFPGTENVLVFGRAKSVAAINEALRKDRKIILLMQKNPVADDPKGNELYQVGVLATIDKTVPGDKGEINALVKGIEIVKVLSFTKQDSWFEAKVEVIKEKVIEDDEVKAMIRYISTQIKKAINLGKTVDFVFLMNILNTDNPINFTHQIAVVLDLKPQERQMLLEETDLKIKLKKEVDFVNREIKVLEIEFSLTSKTQKKFDKGMKESILREKMKTIEEELGEKGEDKDTSEYREKIKKAKMPHEVEEKAEKELKRLKQMSQFNPEASYVRTYLDWLVDLPWSIESANNIEIKAAEKILNEDHYGLKKIKERILEYLAVIEMRKIKEKSGKIKSRQPTILCFVGPPGVGKTSLGKSIARSLGRKFVKMSLGGIRDEAEIRGHRRTYVGALPGRMIQGIKQAGTKNPVFMLDEIDKIGKDYRGDPSSALLEALDPEQNSAFSDHYLDVPFDLSDVFFITTANMLDTIPNALHDRLEVIHFPGYTEEEKFNIAKTHLVQKQLNASSLDSKEGSITDSAVKTIIRRYTREAGVRD